MPKPSVLRPLALLLPTLTLTVLFLVIGVKTDVANSKEKFFASATNASFKKNIKERVDKLYPFYKDLHMHPELSGEESRTAGKIAGEWKKLGFQVTEKVGGHGVVAVLKNGKGPVTMLRAEMDALPVKEETGVPFASTKDGVMHACGHDLHLTNLLGVSQWLSENKKLWAGTLVFVAQPAEENLRGAKAMIEDGLFTRFPKPTVAIAAHTFGDKNSGGVFYRSGPAFASSDSGDIEIFGKGGHGAFPHNAIDPFILTAELILKFQSLIGRETDPLQSKVISVGSVQGGTKHNIIPQSVKVQITVRTFDEALREQLKKRIVEVAEGIAATNLAPKPTVEYIQGTPPVVNDDKLIGQLRGVFKQSVGPQNVEEIPPMMSSEDFAYYGRLGGFPTVFYLLGVRNPKSEGPFYFNHHPKFLPAYHETVEAGMLSMISAVLSLNPH